MPTMSPDTPIVALSGVRLERGGRAVLRDIDLVVPRRQLHRRGTRADARH